jgi:hypothetical protein
MSRSIGKPLAHDAFQRPRGALIVIYAKLHAVAIARVKFRKMSVQMLLAAMLALTMHSALEDREKAFGGIGVSVTAQPPVTGQHRAVTPPLPVLQHLSRDVAEVAEPLRAHPLLQPPAPAQATAPQPAQAHVPASDTEHDVADADEPFADVAAVVDPAIAGELNEMFFAADVDERRLILLNLHVVAPLPPDGLGLARDPSVGQRLEAAALARGREDFAQHLVRALRIPRTQARRIVHDHLGEPVIVAAKALEVPRDALYRILPFVNSAVGHSVERVHALAALYDEISTQAAEGMVAIWQALRNTERARPKYQPVTWNETHARARPAAGQRSSPLAAPPAGTQRALVHRGARSAGSPSTRE